MRARWRPLLLLLATGAALWLLRDRLGLRLDPESVRALVEELGFWGPAVFVGIVVPRVPLGLPSQILLIAGGLCFGTLAGTAYGTAGLALSGVILFLAGRWIGRDAMERRVPLRLRPALDAAGSPLGAAFIGVGTAYPLGPITAYHALAGVTGMSLPSFSLAVALGAIVRSGTYTYFGSRLAHGDASGLVAAAALLAAAALVPLLFPRSRRWVLALARRPGASGPPPGP